MLYEADEFMNLYVKMLLTCETEVVYSAIAANCFQVIFLRFATGFFV